MIFWLSIHRALFIWNTVVYQRVLPVVSYPAEYNTWSLAIGTGHRTEAPGKPVLLKEIYRRIVCPRECGFRSPTLNDRLE